MMRPHCLAPILVVIFSAANGDQPTTRPSPAPVPTVLSLSDATRKIEIRDDNRAQVTLSGSMSSKTLERTFMIDCTERKIHYLQTIVLAMSEIDPRRGGHGEAVTITMNKPIHRVIGLDWDTLDREPVWRGLEEQFLMTVNYDLIQGLFYREMAEAELRQNKMLPAALDYCAALQCLVDWNLRIWDEHDLGCCNDSELVLGEPRSLKDSERYRECVEKSRLAWKELTNDISVRPDDGIIRVIGAEQIFDKSLTSRPATTPE